MEKKKLALVTGGMGGLGTALCRRLHDAGFAVTLTYSPSNTTPEAWLASQRDEGYRFTAYRLDVTDDDACGVMMARLLAEHGRIDVLVNNAGITRDRSLRKMAPDDWHAVLRTNLDSVFHMSRRVIEPMIAQRWGRIINISSVNANAGAFGQANYAAAKAGIIAFSKSLAKEIGSRGITVNVVAPGFIQTDMTDTLPEEAKQALMGQIALGRLGSPSDIAEAVAFLAGPVAAYITGETLNVNGGMYMP